MLSQKDTWGAMFSTSLCNVSIFYGDVALPPRAALGGTNSALAKPPVARTWEVPGSPDPTPLLCVLGPDAGVG